MKNNFKFNNTGNLFLLAFASYYAISIIYNFTIPLAYGGTGELPAAFTWCSYLLNPITFIGVTALYARRKKVNLISAAKMNKKINLKQAGILALLSIFCIMAFLPITNMFLDILQMLGFNMSLGFPETTSSAGAYFLGLLLLAVCPAISEELLMRGAVLNAAEQRRDFSYAILITAAMFSLMHGNPIQTVHQFFLGIVLAYVVMVSRSLWAGVLLHFLNNFLSLTLDWPVSWFFRVTGMDTMAGGYWYIIWIFCVVLGGTMVIYLLKKFTDVSRGKKTLPDGGEVIDVYENAEGVFSAEGGKKEKRKARQNEFENSFLAIFSIFKKGGFKRAYQKVNSIICDIVPQEEDVQPLTREDFFPSNIKLAFIILAVLWLLTLVTGFVA